MDDDRYYCLCGGRGIVKQQGRSFPGMNLDHTALPDPLTQSLEKLQDEIDVIEREIKEHHTKKNKSK